MDESTLEEQMCAWLSVSANGRTPESAREGVRRFLQLARREGYVEGCEDEHGSYPIAPAADAFARAALSKYPIRRTVTEPRVLSDRDGYRYAVVDGRLEWNYGHTERWLWNRLEPCPHPSEERVKIWANLFAAPTITHEVEE